MNIAPSAFRSAHYIPIYREGAKQAIHSNKAQTDSGNNNKQSQLESSMANTTMAMITKHYKLTVRETACNIALLVAFRRQV